ncbi:hypothetical protein M0804_006207 [Polistes exclamans]|nr:hypothetical protein M0804_006207 [Polistes exclamans]
MTILTTTMTTKRIIIVSFVLHSPRVVRLLGTLTPTMDHPETIKSKEHFTSARTKSFFKARQFPALLHR